jgi:hypothetical protein
MEALWMKELAKSTVLFEYLADFDKKLFIETREKGCPKCCGPLHQSSYVRTIKLSGGVMKSLIFRGLCCGREGCRCRVRPPSCRFFGRSQTPLFLFLFAEFLMSSGDKLADLLDEIVDKTGVATRTIFRWRQWVNKTFSRHSRWMEYVGPYLSALKGSMSEHVNKISRTVANILEIRRAEPLLVSMAIALSRVIGSEPLYLTGLDREINSRRVCHSQTD